MIHDFSILDEVGRSLGHAECDPPRWVCPCGVAEITGGDPSDPAIVGGRCLQCGTATVEFVRVRVQSCFPVHRLVFRKAEAPYSVDVFRGETLVAVLQWLPPPGKPAIVIQSIGSSGCVDFADFSSEEAVAMLERLSEMRPEPSAMRIETPPVEERRWPVRALRHGRPAGTIRDAEARAAYAVYVEKYGNQISFERLHQSGGFVYGELTDLLGHEPETWEAGW